MKDRRRNQHTIARPATIVGRGYWSGDFVTLSFRPAQADAGIAFVRADLPARPAVPASVAFREDAGLRTNLRQGEAVVEMVEHVLSALAGLQIDNCIVEISGREIPGFDGSSLPIVDALRSVDRQVQEAHVEPLVIDEIVRFGTDDSWVELRPATDGCYSIEYRLDYGADSAIPAQEFTSVVTPTSYVRDFAPARTFVTAEQAAQLQAAGVAAHVTEDDLLVFDQSGPTRPLRLANECARHKALDVIGDLALAGRPIIGRVISFRGGHRVNGLAAQWLAASISNTRSCGKVA